MAGPVHPGPQVFGRRDPDEFPELVGKMRLVGIAVPGGGRGPVNLRLPVEVADQPPQPLDPGEALRSQTYLCREPPAQRAGQQAERARYLTHPNSP